VVLEHPPARARLDVVEDERGRRRQDARVGDVDARAVGRDLEVVQMRAAAGDLAREVVAVDELARLEVEGEQARRAEAVVRVVEHPQAPLTVDPQR
jgi:hypothetical protein